MSGLYDNTVSLINFSASSENLSITVNKMNLNNVTLCKFLGASHTCCY